MLRRARLLDVSTTRCALIQPFSLFPDKSDPSSVLVQHQNESAYRQLLVQGLLAVLLPTEDFENSCLRAVVCEILAEMILWNGIGGKACEPWLKWEATTKTLEVVQQQSMRLRALSEEKPQDPKSRFERYGLLSMDETIEMVPTSHGG